MIRYHFGFDDPSGTARRGKRLRPQLLLRVALAEGGAVESALGAAVAIEVLHNYSLVHDDIEDGDELRHGRPALWTRYGIAQGINAGDAMCALSYLALLDCEAGSPPERLARMARALHEANLGMCEGQGLDIAFEGRDAVSLDEYRAMVFGKTAALFGASCELGALSARASDARAAAYARMGRAYGVAFQVRDDVLGTWGSSAATGKPSGGDIARRKWTFPVVWALGQPACADRQIVALAYGRRRRLDSAESLEVVAALERLGARAAADDAGDTALGEADRIAGEFDLDRERSIRDFLAQGARRVA
jgi:geranylgeranyl diphosphate synthase type I